MGHTLYAMHYSRPRSYRKQNATQFSAVSDLDSNVQSEIINNKQRQKAIMGSSKCYSTCPSEAFVTCPADHPDEVRRDYKDAAGGHSNPH